MKYNVLVYGSGAREHAFCDKISQSPLLGTLFLALPNDGFKNLGEEIIFADFEDLAEKCVQKSIDLAVIGPEKPLAEGIVDVLQSHGVKCIGTNKFWTQLESSKKFAKEFMEKHDIATARYLTISSVEPAVLDFRLLGKVSFPSLGRVSLHSLLPKSANPTYFDRSTQECPLTLSLSPMGRGDCAKALCVFSSPPVIKADGLAAGKGVHISESFEDAQQCVAEFLDGKFGDASKTVIVEEKLEGEEISLISLYDGKTLLPLIPARDYKKLLDGDKGENTGGMGAFCPVDLSTGQNAQLDNYIKKLETALKTEQANFCGVIYSGLILTKNGIKVLEFNMRFGDPETQVLMMHLDSDLLEIFIKMTEQKLSEIKLDWKQGKSICVVLACDGYPQSPKTGSELKWANSKQTKPFAVGLENPTYSATLNQVLNSSTNDCKIFFAGVKNQNAKILTTGGRVLSVCTTAKNINQAREKIYKAIDKIEFENKIFRKDIGL